MKELKKTMLKETGGLDVNQSGFNALVSRNKGFYVADHEGNISVASHSLVKLLRYSSKEEVLGLNMADKLYESRNDRKDFLQKLMEKGQVEGYEVKMVRKDGTRIILSANSSLLLDKNGAPIGVEGILEHIPEKIIIKNPAEISLITKLSSENLNAEKSFDSMILDRLTGLFNYDYFMTFLNAEIRRVERIFHPTCMMMIDLDNFSSYNKKNGREKADGLLKIVAGLLKDNLRSSDTLCRYSQDQFLAILPETKKDEALVIAKTIKDVIQTTLTEQKVTCSIGMSRFILGMTAQEFFLKANLGLYMAKEAGKNEACLYG